MALTETTFDATVTNTATAMFTETTEGVYMLKIGLEAVANGDTFQFWVEDKLFAGDLDAAMEPTTFRYAFRHAQTAKNVLFKLPIEIKHKSIVYGIRIDGTNRTIRASLRRVSSGS